MAKLRWSWFAIDAKLERNPRFLALRRAGSFTEERALFVCFRLWSLTRLDFDEGFLRGHTQETLSDVLGIPGAVQALLKAQFIVQNDDGFAIRDWMTHNGYFAQERVRKADKKTIHGVSADIPRTTVTYTDTSTKKKNSRSRSLADPPGFDEFWKTYPKRVGKLAAVRAYGKALKGGVSPEAVLSGARRFAETSPDPQYTPHPATWLNAGRWGDEPSLRVVNGSGNEDTIMQEIHRRVAELEGRA